MKHETTKQRLQELAAINNPFLKEGVDPNFPVKLTITVKASDLIEKFGGEDGIGNAALDAQEFNRFVAICQDDLNDWFNGDGGDEWINNGVEQGLYDQFL